MISDTVSNKRLFCCVFFSPPSQTPIVEKIRTIAQKVYGADDIEVSSEARAKIEYYTRQVR